MKKIYLISICLLVCFSAFAQQQLPLDEKHYLDSLENVQQSSRKDSLKAEASFLMVEYWKFKDTVKSKNYLLTGKKLARNYPYLHAVSLFYEGQYFYNINQKKAAAAFKKAEEALRPFHSKNAYGRRAAAWFNYALMEKNTKGYEFVTHITLEKTIPLAEKAGDLEKIAHYYTQLSTVFMNNYQFAKASVYNQKAIELLEKKGLKSSTIIFAYLSGVSIFYYNNQPDKAKPLLAKALALLKPFPGSVNYTLYYYNESLYYTTKSAFDKSLESADKGIILARKYNQKQLYQQLVFRKYEVYSNQKSYAKARQILLDIVKEGILTGNINDRATIYAELAKMNANLKDYKGAYEWLTKNKAAIDSINNSQLKLKINELETKFRSAKNQEVITSLRAQNKESVLIAQNKNLYMWLFGLGCLLLLFILFSVLMNARNKRKLSEQKEINYRQQLEEMEQRQQLKVTKAMLDGEEHERERVARDLHDGLGGMLAGVKIGLSGWKNDNPQAADDKELHRIINQLDSSVGELRRIARNMVPETLLKFGLEVALKDLCEFYMRDELHIAFEPFNIENNIPLPVQLNIYRISQELLSNAIKHAFAKNIILQCTQNDVAFLITIEDDGIGFEPSELAEEKGMGLDNLKNRIAFLNGQIEIISAPNEGTTVNIELNLHEQR